jgi:hypothetical protein
VAAIGNAAPEPEPGTTAGKHSAGAETAPEDQETELETEVAK